MEATVSEIHAYPARPEGYAEPLFHTRHSRREILAHLARSPWLCRASELETRNIEAHKAEDHGGADGRRAAGGSCSRARVLASWREVDRWWEAGGGVDVVWRLHQLESGRQTILAESLREAR